eukprot:8958667-Pyramimonas_sp.AAC.2
MAPPQFKKPPRRSRRHPKQPLTVLCVRKWAQQDLKKLPRGPSEITSGFEQAPKKHPRAHHR